MNFFDILKTVIDTLSQKQPTNSDKDNANALPQQVPANVATNHDTDDVHTYHIADLAEKYETSNRGPGYISNGSQWGDPGGDSYGSYQIETKQGTMAAYLKTNDMFTKTLCSYPVNSKEFKNCWAELATNFPEQFQQSQFDFLCKKANGYNDAIAYAKKIGMMYDNFAMQSAVFSISNQSGGWRNIFNNAKIKPTDDIVTQINKLYDARADYFRNLNINTTIKKNIVLQRTDETMDGKRSPLNTERDDCLKLINRG